MSYCVQRSCRADALLRQCMRFREMHNWPIRDDVVGRITTVYNIPPASFSRQDHTICGSLGQMVWKFLGLVEITRLDLLLSEAYLETSAFQWAV